MLSINVVKNKRKKEARLPQCFRIVCETEKEYKRENEHDVNPIKPMIERCANAFGLKLKIKTKKKKK